MGLLSNEYYKARSQQVQTPVTTQPTPTADQQTAASAVRQVLGQGDPLVKPSSVIDPVEVSGELSLSEQQALKRSQSPWRNFGLSLGESVGLDLPDPVTWQQLNFGGKQLAVASAIPSALKHLVTAAPKEFVRGALTPAVTIATEWSDALSGKAPSEQFGQRKERVELPWVGEVPTYFQQEKDWQDAGLGPIMSKIATVSTALADVTLPYDAAQAVKGVLQPRQVLNGKPVINTAPIKSALAESEGKIAAKRAPVGSMNEYYTMPKDAAKAYGGHSGNTFVKVTPVSPTGGSVEVSIVQTRKGPVQRFADRFTRSGESVYRGDFGPETKKWSKTIETAKDRRAQELSDIPSRLVAEATKYATPEEFVDAMASGRFHGSSTPIKKVLGEDEFYTSDNIYGQGFYTTDDLDIAVGYTEKGKGIEPSLYRVDVPEGIELFDLEAPLTPEQRQQLSPLFRGQLDAGYEKVDLDGFLDDFDTLGSAMSEMVDLGLNTDHAQSVMTEIRKTLEAQGYRGYRHTGGKITGRLPHEVNIFWNPEDIKIAQQPAKTRGQLSEIFDRVNKKGLSDEERAEVLGTVLPRANKGFEAKAITEDQLSHIAKIAEVNGIPDGVAMSVMRAVTGKDAVGALTQAEYTTLAQTMAKMNKMDLFTGPGVYAGAGQYISPQRNWMRALEEKSGGTIKMYSEGHVPIEDAFRARMIFRDQHLAAGRDIFGKYANPTKYGEERRLVFQYMQGNTEAIKANAALSDAVKSDLIRISGELRKAYDELGPVFDIDPEFFLKDYQPHVQNIGGTYQLYKDTKDIPKEMGFFAEKKRVGSNNIIHDDALAVYDIYVNSGSNKRFLNPALERASALRETLPEHLKGNLDSYIGEKLGYADALERHINELVPRINQRLGTNLPPDTARVMAQTMMDNTYAMALGARPDAIVRNLLQAPLLTYPRMGPKFYPQAAAKALTKEGRREVLERGFGVSLGVPYGEELTKEATAAGRARLLHRKVTQTSMVPYGGADLINRATTYHQGKMIWEDALSRYQNGKLNWQQFEREIDMKAFHPIDQNIIRKRLIDGDFDGAFEHYVRDILDGTQFPYRRGSSARMTYGLLGRLGTQFGQWNIEFAHTLGGWLKTGQFEKLIRFNAASSAINRTLDETFNLDAGKWTGLSPFKPTLSPFVQFSGELAGLVSNTLNQNRDAFNDNADALVRSLRSLGFPGVQGVRVEKFMKAYNEGLNESGLYNVRSESGKVNEAVDFADLWWGVLWGFPTKTREAERKTRQRIFNDKAERADAKREALQHLQRSQYLNEQTGRREMDPESSDYKKFIEITNEYQLNYTDRDYESFYIPMNQVLFKYLTPVLKKKYQNVIFQ